MTPGKYADELLQGIKVYSLNRKWKFNPVKLYKLSRIVNKMDINEHLKRRMNEVFKKYYSEDNYYKDCLIVYEKALSN